MVDVNRPSRGTPRPNFRPSTYAESLADEICERIACGESLLRICADEGMPDKTTVIRWLAKNAAFRAAYDRARQVQIDVWAERTLRPRSVRAAEGPGDRPLRPCGRTTPAQPGWHAAVAGDEALPP